MRSFPRAVLAALTALASAVLVLPSSATAHAAPPGTPVSVWLTTPDRANLLAPQPGRSFDGQGSGPVISVDAGASYQSMVGFGASFTDSAAWLMANSPRRNEVMRELFHPVDGIGLSFLRQPIGASDFARNFYTYNDIPAGQTDYALSRFSIAHDEAYVLPVVRQALQLNPEISTMASPWSPPAWMKTNGNLIGGSLRPENRQVFSDYLTRFVQAYQAAGVPIDYLTTQNEPQYSPAGYPGSLYSPQEQSALINTLAPTLDRAGLDTGIVAWDHNWDRADFPMSVLSGPAAPNVAGVAWHCYGGSPSAQSTVRDAHPSYDVFFTECSGTRSADPANTFRDTLRWQTENLVIGATRNWARTVVLWNMALDPSGGPVIGSCTNCTGVVTLDNAAGTVQYNAEYYVLGHASRFVDPGAVRIASSTAASLPNVAFRNPDGSVAMIVLNTSGGAQSFQVAEGGSSFGYTLPAGSVATLTWDETGGNGGDPAATTLRGQASGRCLDVVDGGTANGTPVQLWDCHGGTAQRWTLAADGSVRALGRCLDVSGAGTANGTRVQTWECNGTAAQRWTLNAADDLVNTGSGRCLDAVDQGTGNGTRLQIWDCTGAANQKWTRAG
ncbi:ricin-type beta-trefoil lectin domain protein [Allonocardiopsis opalescens]|uniref:Glucosylceramidase n=1 Tax=Allonocardiopsis opalescens TaxID=1144618 RepID=A0A2T0QEJ7_9ACTN|nr:ricin-type beta-trefoil lectin domain protein [Allonocardiopsis opalescens]PRY02310.1 glucosylceramidase [Allonocardiopsis opalescens]